MSRIPNIGDKFSRKLYNEFLNWALNTDIDSITWLPSKKFEPKRLLMEAFIAGYVGQSDEIKYLDISTDKIVLDKRVYAKALNWYDRYGAYRITNINETVRDCVKIVIRKGILDGLTIEEQKKLLRKFVGLLPKHATAVFNFETRLRDAGYAEDRIEKSVERYRNRLLNYRAKTIAITESHTAVNEGMREFNAELVRSNIISADKYVRSWLVTQDKRTCMLCRSMAGATARLPDGRFRNGIYGPPLHPRCRCTEILLRI